MDRASFRASLLALSIMATMGCQTTQPSKCDPCTAALAVKITNLDQLGSGTRVSGRMAGSNDPHAVEFESSARLFKIFGGPGKYISPCC